MERSKCSTSLFLNRKKTSGFALAEIVVALFFVTLVTLLIGALGQQVINFSKKSRQISGVVELRSKLASMTKNPDGWLDEMRSVTVPTSLGDDSPIALLSCLPAVNDPSAQSFKCPHEDLSIAYNSLPPDLQKLTVGGRYKVMESVVRDSIGIQIAGTTADPVYLNTDGVECTLTPKATKCPLQAIGYFMRENAGVNLNPGNVKFVVKVEMNSDVDHQQSITPMKPQYMSMDIGTAYTLTAGGGCLLPSVFTGIHSDGSSRCEDPQKPCTGGKVQVGYEAAGPICADPAAVATTCKTNEKVILDPVANKLICSSSSPCQSGGTFTGFYSGSGEPMCSKSCSVGSLQMGATGSTAVCKTVATCDPLTQSITYDGDKFTCVDGSKIAGTNGSSGSNGLNGINGGVVIPPECKAGMALSVNATGDGFTCVAPPKPPIIPPTPLCIANPAACVIDPVCENGTLGNDLKRVFVKSTDWKWTPDSVCSDGYVLQNSAGTYIARTFDERPLATSLPIDLKFATYYEPDGLRIVAEGTFGSKVLFSTCQLSTDNEGGTQYGLKKPPNDTIRSFTIQVPEGTLRLKVNRKNNDSPTYVSLRGFCRTFKEQRLNPQGTAKDNANVRNVYQSDVEGYNQYN